MSSMLVAGRGLLGGGDDEQALAHGQRVGVDDADRHRGERVGRGHGRAVGARDLRRDGQAEDGVGAFVDGLLVGGLEGARGRGGGLGQSRPCRGSAPRTRPGVSWRRSSSSSLPKRMVSGTTTTLCSLTSWSVRSQALSVTMWTPGMAGSLPRLAGHERARPGRHGPGVGSGAIRDDARRVERDAAGRGGGSGGGGGGGRRRAASWRRPSQITHGAEGEAARDDGADDPGEQPGGAGRSRQVGDHAGRRRPSGRTAMTDAPERRPRLGGAPGDRTTGGRRPSASSAATV